MGLLWKEPGGLPIMWLYRALLCKQHACELGRFEGFDMSKAEASSAELWRLLVLHLLPFQVHEGKGDMCFRHLLPLSLSLPLPVQEPASSDTAVGKAKADVTKEGDLLVNTKLVWCYCRCRILLLLTLWLGKPKPMSPRRVCRSSSL